MATRTVPPGVGPTPRTTPAGGDASVRAVRILLLVLAAGAVHVIVHGPLRAAALALTDRAAEGALVTLSLVQLALGVGLFLRAGGRAITPIGVYSLALGLYFGYGGLAPAASKTSTQYLVHGSVAALAFNLGVLFVAARTTDGWAATRSGRRRGVGVDAPIARDARPTVLSLPLHVGLWAAFTLGAPLVRQVPFVGVYADLLQIAVSLLLLQAFLRNSLSDHPLRFAVGLPIFAAMSLGSYLVLYYSGFGRIIFAGFLAASAILIGRRYRWLPIKVVAIALLVPAIAFAVSGERTGLAFGEALDGVGEARGVSSMTGVLPVFAMTLEHHDRFGLEDYEHRDGRTFWVSAVHWVPREWWPEKPNGPEIELAQLLYPEVAFGYSIVGSNAVEWVLNFDPPALVPGALLTGLALGLTDRWARGAPRRRRALPHDAVLRALVTGNLVILVWAGSFSFTARTFIGSVLVLALRRLAVTGRRLRPAPPSAVVGVR